MMQREMKMNSFNRTTAILPTRSSLNLIQPQKNEFHASWKECTYLLLESEADFMKPSRQIILSGSGTPAGYPEVGSIINAHHDQTMAQLGRWSVVAKVSRDQVGTLPAMKPSLPLYVYK
jgi:hypothetical protein